VRTTFADASSQVELIACERNDGETKETYCLRGERLQKARFEAPAGESGPAPQSFELLVPRPCAGGAQAPMLVKVLARDSRGRRMSTWLTLDDRPAGVQLTSRPATSTVR
jgi:hypothetical protein